jgi:hypothetical protein
VNAFSWFATALVAVLLVAFVAYLVSLRKLPLEITQQLPAYDRHGHLSTEEQLGNAPSTPGPAR